MVLARERELIEEVQRLREANRRLQAHGAELERDRLVVALRAEIRRLTMKIHDTHLMGDWVISRQKREDGGKRSQISLKRHCLQCGQVEEFDVFQPPLVNDELAERCTPVTSPASN